MFAAKGATNPAWLYEFLPVLVFLVGLASLVLGARSWFLERIRKKHEEEDRDILILETVARVMGRPANPSRGQDAVTGLVTVVPEIQRRVESLTLEIGDRAVLADTNLVQLIEDIRRDVAKMVPEPKGRRGQ